MTFRCHRGAQFAQQQHLQSVFYPADGSPVCGEQAVLYNYSELLPEFEQYPARLLRVTVDGPWCHMAYAKDRRLRYPLLSDFDPKAEVSRHYDIRYAPERR